MGLLVSRSHVQLSEQVDRSTEVAAAGTVRKACRNAAQTRRRNRPPLPDEGSLRSGGGRQREHPHADQSRPRLPEPTLSAAEGQAGGGDQRRVSRCPAGIESCLKTGRLVRFSRRADFALLPPPVMEELLWHCRLPVTVLLKTWVGAVLFWTWTLPPTVLPTTLL